MKMRKFLNEKSWERDFGDIGFDYNIEGVEWDTDEVYKGLKKVMGTGLFGGGLFTVEGLEDYLSDCVGSKVKCNGCGASKNAFMFSFEGKGIRHLYISVLF